MVGRDVLGAPPALVRNIRKGDHVFFRSHNTGRTRFRSYSLLKTQARNRIRPDWTPYGEL